MGQRGGVDPAGFVDMYWREAEPGLLPREVCIATPKKSERGGKAQLLVDLSVQQGGLPTRGFPRWEPPGTLGLRTRRWSRHHMSVRVERDGPVTTVIHSRPEALKTGVRADPPVAQGCFRQQAAQPER